jgi:acetyl-CoA carboxylase carboxyltransferase component
MNGNQVPEKIEEPCHKIANALHSLSEISFIFPYSKNRPYDVTEIEKILQDKLSHRSPEKAFLS